MLTLSVAPTWRILRIPFDKSGGLLATKNKLMFEALKSNRRTFATRSDGLQIVTNRSFWMSSPPVLYPLLLGQASNFDGKRGIKSHPSTFDHLANAYTSVDLVLCGMILATVAIAQFESCHLLTVLVALQVTSSN